MNVREVTDWLTAGLWASSVSGTWHLAASASEIICMLWKSVFVCGLLGKYLNLEHLTSLFEQRKLNLQAKILDGFPGGGLPVACLCFNEMLTLASRIVLGLLTCLWIVDHLRLSLFQWLNLATCFPGLFYFINPLVETVVLVLSPLPLTIRYTC